MIVYQGLKNNRGVSFLCFSNEKGAKIEIPVDEPTARRIALYLIGLENKRSSEERKQDELLETEIEPDSR